MKLCRVGVLGVSIGVVGRRTTSCFDGKRLVMKLAILRCRSSYPDGDARRLPVAVSMLQSTLTLGFEVRRRADEILKCTENSCFA
jgi:hypothetical protein